MATIVIVHGAFGGGWEWHEVATQLRGRGHEVYTPTLTGFGERVHLATPDIGLETNIQDILNLFHYEDLTDVTLVCQSYGGMVATGVADRIPERINHLVYLNALAPENGQSVLGLTPPAFRKRFEEAAQTDGEGWRIPVPPFEDDPQIAAFARGRYVPTPLRPFTEPIELGPFPEQLRRTYIWCTKDQEGLDGVADLMRPFAERARADPDWEFQILNEIPDAYILVPDIVADLIDQATTAP